MNSYWYCKCRRETASGPRKLQGPSVSHCPDCGETAPFVAWREPVMLVGADCQIHHSKMYHKPIYTYCEQHHVIPQAWQFFWQPNQWNGTPTDANFPYAGLSPDHPGMCLWDARTLALCRTGHGNVHFYLVRLMHELAGGISKPEDQRLMLVHALIHVDRRALDCAQEAMSRFTDVGGSLETLAAAHEWGSI